MTEPTRNPPFDSTDADPRLDAKLDAVLGNLPRETAGEHFVDSVLRRLPANDLDPPRPDHGPRRGMWIALAAMLLVAVAFGWREWSHARQRQQDIERIAELRAEYLMLQAELDQMQQMRATRPVVYLGGADDVEVVLDLSNPAVRRKLAALGLSDPRRPEGDDAYAFADGQDPSVRTARHEVAPRPRTQRFY